MQLNLYQTQDHKNKKYLMSPLGVSQELLMNDKVKEFAANVYETFSTPLELQK